MVLALPITAVAAPMPSIVAYPPESLPRRRILLFLSVQTHGIALRMRRGVT
jgi:hypothetical protein